MLRSLDLLRQTAQPSCVIADGDEHIILFDGGVGYAKPWHWHDGLMLLLPWVGILKLKHEGQRDGAWLTDDRFAVVPASHAHDTSAFRSDQTHIAVYVRDAALRRIEAQLGSLNRFRAAIRTSAMFSVSPEIRTLHALCREGSGDPVGRDAVRAHLSAALLIRCLGAIERGAPLPTASRHGHGAALIREAKAFVAARLDQDVPLDLLAANLRVSRRHITRLFQAEVGQSVGAFQASQAPRRSTCHADHDGPVGRRDREPSRFRERLGSIPGPASRGRFGRYGHPHLILQVDGPLGRDVGPARPRTWHPFRRVWGSRRRRDPARSEPGIGVMSEVEVVRVFTCDGAGGNPCPVFAEANALDADAMQAVARRYGHESGFVLSPADDAHELAFRFFVPNHEMEMCAHATIGALWVLARRGRLTNAPVGSQRRAEPSQASCRSGMTGRGAWRSPSLPGEWHRSRRMRWRRSAPP